MNIISSIVSGAKRRRLARYGRLKFKTREAMGWAKRPKAGSPELSQFRARRKYHIAESRRQMRGETLGRLGAPLVQARGTVPIAIGGAMYVAGRQERSVRRKLQERSQRKKARRLRLKRLAMSKRAKFSPELRRSAKKWYRVGRDVGRPLAAGLLGYEIGVARVYSKKKRRINRETIKAMLSDNVTIDSLKKVFINNK